MELKGTTAGTGPNTPSHDGVSEVASVTTVGFTKGTVLGIGLQRVAEV